MAEETSEPVKIYLDDQDEPFKTATPPLRFSFSTIHLADGEHTLRVEASNGLAPPTQKHIPFRVRNGVAVTVSGLEPNQTIGGQVELIVNAYAGNTEVDFEPRRAETPQPVPTWAWVLTLAVLAWTLFYLFNPVRAPRNASAHVLDVGHDLGQRLYMDTCARCHGEDGTGLKVEGSETNYLVKRLRDTPNLAVAESPYKLLFKVVTGTPTSGDVHMPAWGPRLTNEEIVAVVNFVRNSWGHDASLINPRFRRAPRGIEELDEDFLDAMVSKDVVAMCKRCWPESIRPQLYRIDGPIWARGFEEVQDAWLGYFEALGSGEILDFQLTDVRYDYEPATVNQLGSYVFAMGRIFLSTRSLGGVQDSDTGRFIRVYRRVKKPGATGLGADGEPEAQWAMLFDFASIRMRVGCDVNEEDCPPGMEVVVEESDEGLDLVRGIGYAQIQELFRDLNQDVGDAPHEDFWELPYKEFVELKFPISWEEAESMVPLLVVGDSLDSNLVRGLRGGVGLKVHTERGKVVTRNIQPMPKGAKSMDEKVVATIAAWIDAQCPEFPLSDEEVVVREQELRQRRAAGASGGAVRQPVGPGGGDVRESAFGYAEVQQLFANLGRDAGDAAHEAFWELPYDEFVNLSFPFTWDNTDITVKLLEPYDSKNSNLIRAMSSGRGLVVTNEDGTTSKRNIAVMPKGGKPMDAESLRQLADWIDAGCPEVAGLPSALPRPGAVGGAGAGSGGGDTDGVPAKDPQDVPKKDPAPEKAPGAAPGKSAYASKPGATTNIGYADVQRFFAELKNDPGDAPHEAFWDLPYKEFVELVFPFSWDEAEITMKLLEPGNAADSNIIKAITTGRGLIVLDESGKKMRKNISVMPKGQGPMDEAKVKALASWIDSGCPEFPPKGSKPAEAPKKEPAIPAAPGSDFPAPGGG